MPKKKRQETQAEQSARFKRDAQKLIDAGELNPTDADEAVDRIVRKAAIHSKE
jgi:deoxyribose-phosphate aldolase